MRYVVEEIAPKHWHWTLMWGDRKVADSPTTYGSESAATQAALTFSRLVERADQSRRG